MQNRTIRAVALVAAGFTLAALPVVEEARGTSSPWVRDGSAMAGFGRYAGGEWVYQDFVYDDDEQADNTADIVQVRIAAHGNDLLVRVVLNSLFDPTSTVVGVALGTDASEVREWPDGAGVSSRWDRFVTADATTRMTEADGTEQALAPAAVDLAENTVDVRIPEAAHDNPTLELVVGAGERSEDGNGWAGEPVDLAFNRHDQEPIGSNFRDSAQQDAIAGGDVSDFFQRVDVAAVRDHAVVDPPIVEPGLYNRVYRSSQDLGEGYASDEPTHRGLYQPYAIWIPAGYDPSSPTPLLLVMHSLGQIHNQYNTGQYYPQVAGQSGAIAITPLALGDGGWYWDEALVDTLEVWVDTVDNFNIDAERVYSSGYSMGGYGTYRLTTLFPELFAGAVSWVGPPTDGIWLGTDITNPPGLTYHQLESVAHVPFYIVHGTNDELVPVTGVTRQAQKFHDLGYPYRYALHPGQDHFSFAIINNWAREADWLHGRTRVVDPAYVAFDVRPEAWVSRTGEARAAILDHIDRFTARLGAARDGAYWVSGITARGEGDVTGEVALTSHGIAARVPVVEEITTVGEVQPGYGSTLGPSPHLLRGVDRRWDEAPVENVLSGSLVGVGEVTVDLARARLGLDGLDLQIEVDGPTVVRLVDGDRADTVTLS